MNGTRQLARHHGEVVLQKVRRYRSASTAAEVNYRKWMGFMFVVPVFLVAAIGGVVVGAVVGETGGLAAFLLIFVAESIYLEWKIGSRPVQRQPNSPTKRLGDGVTVVDRDYQE